MKPECEKYSIEAFSHAVSYASMMDLVIELAKLYGFDSKQVEQVKEFADKDLQAYKDAIEKLIKCECER